MQHVKNTTNQKEIKSKLALLKHPYIKRLLLDVCVYQEEDRYPGEPVDVLFLANYVEQLTKTLRGKLKQQQLQSDVHTKTMDLEVLIDYCRLEAKAKEHG